MSVYDRINQMIDIDTNWRVEEVGDAQVDFNSLNEQEQLLFKKAFIKGLQTAKFHVKQVQQADMDLAEETIEEMFIDFESALNVNDLENLLAVVEGLLTQKEEELY